MTAKVSTRAWVMNFDAERELENPNHHTSCATTERRAVALIDCVKSLFGHGDAVIQRGWRAREVLAEGRAWCPTPKAMRAWQAAEVIVPAVPALSVLRRVNHRRFSAELGQFLPHADFVDDARALETVIRNRSPTGVFLLKRPFGFTGRGRLRVKRGAPLDDRERAFVAASFGEGLGLQVEPWVDRRLDVALHGFVRQTGEVTLGVPTRQTTSAQGAWITSARMGASDLTAEENTSLHREAERTGHALHHAGYFGPFGIDGFRWVDEAGSVHFNPRCEINARYSMGWATGMGDTRPDLECTAECTAGHAASCGREERN
ncbi:MAG: hypothetical protein NVS3B20_01940 [Polyangiales bacterium]